MPEETAGPPNVGIPQSDPPKKPGGCGCGTVLGVLAGLALVFWTISLFQGPDPCAEARGIEREWEQAKAANDEYRVGALANEYLGVQQECLAKN